METRAVGPCAVVPLAAAGVRSRDCYCLWGRKVCAVDKNTAAIYRASRCRSSHRRLVQMSLWLYARYFVGVLEVEGRVPRRGAFWGRGLSFARTARLVSSACAGNTRCSLCLGRTATRNVDGIPFLFIWDIRGVPVTTFVRIHWVSMAGRLLIEY